MLPFHFYMNPRFLFGAHLELQLHGGDRLSGRRLAQLLDVGVEVAGGHLRVAAGGRLQQRLVDEDVLVLRLHHVVPLGAHARHVAVDVHRLLVLHALQHGLDHDQAARAAHAGAGQGKGGRRVSGTVPSSKLVLGDTLLGFGTPCPHTADSLTP